jgi:hypothetical protein
VAEVPVEVLDAVIFQRVMGKVLYGKGTVDIGVEGTVDGKLEMKIGEFAVRGVPVKGVVPVEGNYGFDQLKMGLVGDIEVLGTTRSSITLGTMVQVRNPTPYEADIPYLNVQILYQGYAPLRTYKDISLGTPPRRMQLLPKGRIKSREQ